MSGHGFQNYVGLNGAVLDASEARISPLGDGFMYGCGVFETIRVIGGRLAFFHEHIDRLRDGAAELGLLCPSSLSELHLRCSAVIAANRTSEGSLKIVLFCGENGMGELIATREGAYAPARYARGFKLKTIPDGHRAGKISRLKTLNYLKAITARRDVQAEGFDEALFVASDGSALEGATSNLFAVKCDAILTPPLDGAILPGIARSVVLRLLDGRNVSERAISSAQLAAASEVFVTNSLLGVMPVTQVNQQTYDVGKNPITTAVMAAYRRAEMESTRNVPPISGGST